MVRNPIKRAEEKQEPEPVQESKQDSQMQVIEREITLALINDKINYMTGLLHKIAEACQIDLSQN